MSYVSTRYVGFFISNTVKILFSHSHTALISVSTHTVRLLIPFLLVDDIISIVKATYFFRRYCRNACLILIRCQFAESLYEEALLTCLNDDICLYMFEWLHNQDSTYFISISITVLQTRKRCDRLHDSHRSWVVF